ncbi:MAG: ATP-binding protein [Methylococcaceae bacterium]|nr:ATP-binding protein [Methylococcaceae bacterium]
MLTHVSPIPKSQLSARQNLKWLFILRNMMVLSESLLIFLSVYGLNIRLPEQQLWLVIISIIAVNAYTLMRLDTDEAVTQLEIFLQLSMDVLGITGLLYLTGGASNPIIWVFLLPVIIAAIMLPQSYAWYMVILTTTMYTILVAYNIPLPSIEPHAPNPEMMHPGAGLVAFFVVALAKALKIQERNLAEARESALRDERVVALGTLAASAAHDMGTPLGIIAIVAHELEQEYPADRYPDLHQKALIMQQQINRCKDTLSVMSASAGEMRAESGSSMLLTDYIDSVIMQWRTHQPSAKLNFFIEPTVATEAKIIAERTLTHSIINILNNAAEATRPELGIEFHADWDLTELTLKIRDFGSGLPPELLEFAGKQPVVSKKRGLGVGLFLTYSTISRLGGKINLYNMDTGGACVEITLPLLITENDNDHYGNG